MKFSANNIPCILHMMDYYSWNTFLLFNNLIIYDLIEEKNANLF